MELQYGTGKLFAVDEMIDRKPKGRRLTQNIEPAIWEMGMGRLPSHYFYVFQANVSILIDFFFFCLESAPSLIR